MRLAQQPFLEATDYKNIFNMRELLSVQALAVAQSFPNGYFKLTTQFRESANECLESTSDGNSAGANMDPCGNFSGQLWKIK